MSTNLPYDENELLTLVAAGNEKAFEKLISQYAGLLQIFLFKITHDSEAVDELVQDTFLRIWMTRENLQHVQSFKPYLFTISKNLGINLLKKSIRIRLQHTQWIADKRDLVEDDNAEWKWKLFDSAVENLPPQQKKVWVMARREGKKYQKIADELNLSKETIKKYLQFASAAIYKYIDEHAEIYMLFIYLILHHS